MHKVALITGASSGIGESSAIFLHNNGFKVYGAIKDVPMEEARRQFDVNIFGLACLTLLVLPKMRENRFGKIVNISYMGGEVYTPLSAMMRDYTFFSNNVYEILHLSE